MKRSAFTLVELSIVLVILGLLVGGVLAGQSLIHAAELRAATTEYTNYKIALGAFREKYFALPGDMPNAVKFWGKAAGGTADGVDGTCAAYTTAATDSKTCNGDGNGMISTPLNGNAHEYFRAWQHLANAGLVEGNYSGVAGAGSNVNTVIGTNIPRSKISSAGWFLMGIGSYSNASYFQANYGNILLLGAQVTNFANYNPVMKAEDMYNIDTKTDDGKPHTGRVLSFKHALLAHCANASDDDYLLSDATVGCSILFITGF